VLPAADSPADVDADNRAHDLVAVRLPQTQPPLRTQPPQLPGFSRPCRCRVNVLWALLRDGRCYEPTPPVALAA